ncbi:MAG: hypothetical protein KC731_38595, partial [Myxococcales bacterium]|nr:hypothetical protein [Myxococcales bacterium]
MAAATRMGVLASLAISTAASTAAAADFEVSTDIVGQGYEVAGPWGDVVLGRRRLYASLGLGAYNLQGDFDPDEAVYNVALRMRVDADFGYDGAEYNYDIANAGRYVPGLPQVPVDLMYGYVEGKNIGGGWF